VAVPLELYPLFGARAPPPQRRARSERSTRPRVVQSDTPSE
jgi:hypothetical protein